MGKFNRTLAELREKAVLFWTEELKQIASTDSVLPLLLETQEKFLSILNFADAHPEAWIDALPLSTLSGNLFLKHVMVLSDLGGEALNKITPLSFYFTNGVLEYSWQGKMYSYRFSDALNANSLHNKALQVDGKSVVLEPRVLSPKMRDIVMLTLFGDQSVNNLLPTDIRAKCVIGNLIGRPDELEAFVRQSYIRVSRQIGGANSNALGQATQNYVFDVLKDSLPDDWKILNNASIPGVSHNANIKDSTFDIVGIAPSGLRFGIEVSFQFTTNSVIERKAAQARARQIAVHETGNFICYVLDGAGNINVRVVAAQTICDHSDCTVAFSMSEIEHLARFMLEKAAKQ
jgi:hypothetical protein